MSLDVKQLYGVAELQAMNAAQEMVEVSTGAGGGGGIFSRHKTAPPPPPPPAKPQKIAVSATVQCAFQIQ